MFAGEHGHCGIVAGSGRGSGRRRRREHLLRGEKHPAAPDPGGTQKVVGSSWDEFARRLSRPRPAAKVSISREMSRREIPVPRRGGTLQALNSSQDVFGTASST